MDLKQLVSVIRILLLVLVLLGALFGALAGFRKGFYKTTTKTILKAILVIVAVFLAVPVANLISNIEISGLNTVWRNRNGGSGELNPPTLQNFVSAYLRNRTGLSPRNGISVYQRAWNLASSLIAIFVFFIERILIQILISLLTAIVYNGIFRWIIPAETKAEWKERRKKKKRSSLTAGMTNDDGSVSANKTRKKWHLLRFPATRLGAIQEFIFVCLLVSPLTGLSRRAINNKDVVNKFLSDDDNTKTTANDVMDAVSESALYKRNGINNWDLALLNKASEFESAGGVKVSFSGLVDSVLDVAKPVLDKNAISYNATAGFVINYSALLSTGTVTTLLSSLAQNKQIRALVPSLIEAATSSLTGTNFPVQQLDRKDIQWDKDINALSGIYQSRYEYIIQPIITSDNQIDASKLALDPTKRDDKTIESLSNDIGTLGNRDIVQKNRPVILAYAGRYRSGQGINILPANAEAYKDVNWGSEFQILFKNVLTLARTLNIKFDSSTNYNALPDTIREGLGDETKFSQIQECLLGNAGKLGIRDRNIFKLVSVPDRMQSLVTRIPGISKYAKQIDFNSVLGGVNVKSEISSRFDIRKPLFAKDSPIDLRNIDKIDLSDDKTVETLSLVFHKASNSLIFSQLLPIVSKAFFFNSDFDFKSYRFSLTPYCFNYDDKDFLNHREEVLLIRPKRRKMVKTRSDNSLTDSQKVQAIDTETIHKLLGIVVESEFFNSNKETGITSEEQKNANLYYFLKGLFSSDRFENFRFTLPSLEEREKIQWGDDKGEGEITRICKILDYAKENSDFIFSEDRKLSKIKNSDAIASLIETGRESELVRPCALEIIDQSLNAYLKNIGINISFNDRRNNVWNDDAKRIAEILDLLKKVDLNNFDFASLDTDRLNALLTLLSERNLIKISNQEKDPFGYALYKRLSSQDARKKMGLDATRDVSLFSATDSDPWVETKKTIKIDEKDFKIDTTGRISSICSMRRAIQDVGIDNLSSGKIPAGFFQNENLVKAFDSSFVCKVFVSFMKTARSQINLKDWNIPNRDFLELDILENRSKDEFRKTLNFIDFLYQFSNGKIDGKSKFAVRMTNPFQWKTTNAYPEITDASNPHYGETFQDVFNYRVNQRTSLDIFTYRKDGYLFAPISYFLKKIISQRNRTGLRTRHQGDEALNGLFAEITKEQWLDEGTHRKTIVDQRQGRNEDSISIKDRTYNVASSLLTERNKSKILHRVPITRMEESRKQVGVASLLKDPDTGKVVHPLNFNVHLGTEQEDISFWNNEIENALQMVLGEHSIRNLLKGEGIDLSNASLDKIDLSFLYYLGKRQIFKQSRSYLFYNLVNRLTSDSIKGTGKSVSLFALSTNAPYGESAKAYRIEELFFSNPKLLVNGELDKEKSFTDLGRVKAVLSGIFSQLPKLIDTNLENFKTIEFDFETMAYNCFKLEKDGNTIYRSDFASEVFAGTRNAFFQNPNVVNVLGTNDSGYNFYANDHQLVNPKEGRALNGLIKFVKASPSQKTITVPSLGEQKIPYYSKDTLSTFYPLFGESNPKPDDLIYKSFYQDGSNSVFIQTFQDKVFKLPVRKKDGNIAVFNTVATIDLSNKTVKEILDSAEIR